MVKRTQSLPLNIIILAIIVIVVLVFLIEKFIPQMPNQPTPLPHPIPSPNQQCLIDATTIDIQIGTYTNNSLAQLQLLANSSYVSSNCSIYFQYSFSLYNNSQVVCGLGSGHCINLQGSGCNHCTPPNCIPGCELK